jgi:4'-phosphopantetheinyl transferase
MADAKLPLAREQVQIWKIPLPLPGPTVARLEAWLSRDERERIARLHFLKDRHRHTSARGALRVILAAYLGQRPGDLSFGYGRTGKPFLAAPPEVRGVQFNLSHCEDLAVIGVASSLRLGVDVENIRHFPEMEHIVERYFDKEERSSIAAASGERRVELFLRFWTRREAAAKAKGLDLCAALSDLGHPPYPPGSVSPFVHTDLSRWVLQDLILDSRHVGAVCTEGPARVTTDGDFDAVLGGADR